MKNKSFIFSSLLCAAAAVAMTACDNDDLYIGGADTGILGGGDGNVVYITDGKGHSDFSFVEFSGSYTLDLYARTSNAASGACTVTFSYDTAVLADYNASQETEIPAFPQNRFTLSNNGKVTIASGALESDALAVTFSSDGKLDPTQTYAIPFKVSVANGSLVGNAASYIVLVQDCTAFPGTDKTYQGEPGMKIVGVVEVNEHNPLNVIPFTMKGSGKQFFDMVVLFSANINYSATTGRVYLSRNENVQALLDQREKYIKPLQDRGIKVILGILGNHDVSGICTMSRELSRQFAQEVKMVCDAYELDGVFLDDEYTKYEDAATSPLPGFHGASYQAASEFAYEIKMAQPERLVLAYRYFALAQGLPVDGVQPGEFFDYVLNDYIDNKNPVNYFPGLRQDQAGTGSWNCTNADWTKARWFPGEATGVGNGGVVPYNAFFSLPQMREEGYGALMIYNFYCDPQAKLTPKIIKAMEETAEAFYEGELEYDGSWYPKDY